MLVKTLLMLLQMRKGQKIQAGVRAANAAKNVAEEFEVSEIARNAAAYGFEIGAFSAAFENAAEVPLPAEVSSSRDNPFMDPKWYEKVVKSDD